MGAVGAEIRIQTWKWIFTVDIQSVVLCCLLSQYTQVQLHALWMSKIYIWIHPGFLNIICKFEKKMTLTPTINAQYSQYMYTVWTRQIYALAS